MSVCRSSLTRVLSRAKDIHPAHLSRFAVRFQKGLCTRLFLEVRNHQVARPKSDLITSRANAPPFVSLESLEEPPYERERGSMHRAWPIPLPSPLTSTPSFEGQECSFLFSITYAFRPRLRYRLTHGRIIPTPRNAETSGDQISHLVYRYSCLHKLFSGPIPVLTIRRVSTREYSCLLLTKPESSVLTLLSVIFFELGLA